MGVPIADKMQPVPVHMVNFSLLLAPARDIKVSRTSIRVTGTTGGGDRYIVFRKAREQLSTGFKRTMVALLMFCEMIQDSGVDDEALLGLTDFKYEVITVSLSPQQSQNGSFSQLLSS